MDDKTINLHLRASDQAYVPLGVFLSALDEWRQYLVAVQGAAQAKSVDWMVTELSVGSAHVAATAVGDPALSARVSDLAFRGLRALECDELLPPEFTDEAVAAAKDLVEETQRRRLTLSVARQDGEITVSGETIRVAGERLAVAVWEDFGSLEGTLEMVNVHDGHTCFIWEAISGQRVACDFHPDLMDVVRNAFGRRVLASGRVRYTRTGRIAHAYINELTLFLTPESLPTVAEMSGIMPDFSTGLTLEEHLRRVRRHGG